MKMSVPPILTTAMIWLFVQISLAATTALAGTVMREMDLVAVVCSRLCEYLYVNPA